MDLGSTLLGWIVPALIVFGVAAALIAVGAWLIRRALRGPRARATADARRQEAGAKLVRLDDQVAELELEVGLSGALYGGDAPTSLRRARITAQHTRDALFDRYRTATSTQMLPREVARESDRISADADRALALMAKARAEHADWMRRNVTAVQQIAAARTRLGEVRASMGDPSALVADLSERFDVSEWQDAAAAASAAIAHADEAERLLNDAAARAEDPTAAALPVLAAGERELRKAQESARVLEETHRLVLQAAAAAPSELAAARAAIRQASITRGSLEPGDAERLGEALRGAESALDALEPTALRRPTESVDSIARVRDRLDLALGDARTAQQRLRGARTALPGTLAAARAAVARAEGSVSRAHAGADARVRLAGAQQELAAARQASDPVEALDAARRAMRAAEDAQALADYARLGGTP